MSVRIAAHHFAPRDKPLPPIDDSLWLDYVVGAGGVYARGRRAGLEVCMPVASARVRGLGPVEPYVEWGFPRIPARFLGLMLAVSRQRCASQPAETLFHLSWSCIRPAPADAHSSALAAGEGWLLEFPEQLATHDRVRPLHQGRDNSEARAVIEVHTHPYDEARFSEVDDADEGGLSFRVYAVLGRLFDRPEVRCRVGLFGHFMEWGAREFFELPAGVTDCLSR